MYYKEKTKKNFYIKGEKLHMKRKIISIFIILAMLQVMAVQVIAASLEDQKSDIQDKVEKLLKSEKKTQKQMKLSLLLVITWLLSMYFNQKKKPKK